MSSSGRRLLWGMIAAGTALRLVLAFTTTGQPFDIQSYAIVREELARVGLDVYSTVNQGDIYRWPYLPGYFAWLVPAGETAERTALPFHGLVQLPAIAADAALAWLVQAFLGQRGAAERARLAAVALVAGGPVFILISGHHGQIDSLAILPALAALMVWQRPEGRNRALWAGALIGVGCAFKTTPALIVLALLPSVRSWREAGTLVAASAAVPLVAFAPFLLTTPADAMRVLSYSSAPGMGGMSLALQPGLADFWLTEIWQPRPEFEASAVSRWLFDHGGTVTAVALALTGAFLIRYRADAVSAAVLVWLAIYAFGSAFFFQYLIWGLPFFLVAGKLRQSTALQTAVLVPALLFYVGPRDSTVALWIYVPLMLAVWAALVVAFFRTASGIAAGRRPTARTLG